MKNELEKYIIDIANYPKKGITFKDISPLLLEKFSETIDQMSQQVNWEGINAIAGIESRGFILGAALAQKQKIGFIPIRKKGKLPPPTISENYTLEYGEDSLEIKSDYPQGQKVLIVDDVIATGGTLKASISLCIKANMEIKAVSSLINLSFLNKDLPKTFPIYSLFEY